MSQKVLLRGKFSSNEGEKAWDPETNPVGTFSIDGKPVTVELLNQIKSGKEATVYACRAHVDGGPILVAAKYYRRADHRTFTRDAVYQEGRVWTRREKEALAKKSGFGRSVGRGVWIDCEYATLKTLHRAGADVPRPLGKSGNFVVMEFIGDEETPASMLKQAKVPPQDAPAMLDRIVWNIRLMLANHVVHGDLSAFNLMSHGRRIVLIDFPQAVDPRYNPNAEWLLARDLKNVAAHFARYGAHLGAGSLAVEMWDNYVRGMR